MVFETFMKSGVLTLAGMSVVFAFMLCMMLLVTALIRVSERFVPDAVKNIDDGGEGEAVVAAIVAVLRSKK